MAEFPPTFYQNGRGFRATFPVDVSRDPRLQYIAYDGPEILNIGSGVNPIPGAVNVDLREGLGANLQFDILEPWPLDDKRFDKVVMFQVLEHVTPTQSLPVVKEAYRVLRPNGLLIVETPDMRGMCREWLDGNVGVMVGGIFGGYGHPTAAHRYGWTADALGLLVILAGFERFVTGPGKDYHAGQISTVRVEAVKWGEV